MKKALLILLLVATLPLHGREGHHHHGSGGDWGPGLGFGIATGALLGAAASSAGGDTVYVVEQPAPQVQTQAESELLKQEIEQLKRKELEEKEINELQMKIEALKKQIEELKKEQ